MEEEHERTGGGRTSTFYKESHISNHIAIVANARFTSLSAPGWEDGERDEEMRMIQLGEGQGKKRASAGL